MAKTHLDTWDVRTPPTPVLSASVRRHLGKTLRSFYAPTLSEPVSERMEALLARLQTQRETRSVESHGDE